MATIQTDSRQKLTIGVRFRMFIRFLGLTALLAAGAGAIYLSSVLANWRPETLLSAIKNEINSLAFIGSLLLFGGVVLAFVALVIEVFAYLSGGTGGRGAVGVNAVVQIALAAALVVAINVYAFIHPASIDLTSKKLFTLPDNVTDELQQLNSDTTIVVLQQHKTFGRLSDKPDRYDYAAERKVVEKVLDTVAQFQELGPRFKVVVLDVEEESFKRKFDEVTKDKPMLRDAINAAPENSILFFSEGKVQRLSFNEFYQLDKQASLEVEGKNKGNLKLQPQDLKTLITRITAIEEKRPRVAVLVTHPLLMTLKRSGSGAEEYTLSGLKKSLNTYGIDVVDAVVKKNHRPEAQYEGEPATLTSEESQIMRLEDKLENAKEVLKVEKNYGERLARNIKKIELVESKPLKDRIDTYLDAFGEMRRRRISLRPEERNDPEVQANVERFILGQFKALWKEHQQDLADAEQDFKRVNDELALLRTSERSIEDKYLTDHKAKLTRLLADCDMLIIPRMTIINATTSAHLPRNLHKLDKSQIDIIKDFMKSGKPVLVCAGPINTPNEGVPEGDDLEKLLGERGFELAKQTVLFNVEIDSFKGSAQQEDELEDRSVEVPPVSFAPPDDWKQGKLKANPISLALAVLNASVEQPLQIQLRAPRPIRVTASQETAQGFEGSFLWTNQRSWAENYPFDIMFRMQPNPFNPMQMQRTIIPRPRPRFDLPEEGKKAGAEENEYKGPISIAASIEGRVPEFWYTDKEKDMERKSSRVVVIGHGSIFNKPELSPATERLLLVVSNWLLKREDRLPRKADPAAPVAANRPWEYPRVEMTEGTKQMWRWGAFLGLPGLCVYLGLIVLMIRKVR
jgi:hypothetical protein